MDKLYRLGESRESRPDWRLPAGPLLDTGLLNRPGVSIFQILRLYNSWNKKRQSQTPSTQHWLTDYTTIHDCVYNGISRAYYPTVLLGRDSVTRQCDETVWRDCVTWQCDVTMWRDSMTWQCDDDVTWQSEARCNYLQQLVTLPKQSSRLINDHQFVGRITKW